MDKKKIIIAVVLILVIIIILIFIKSSKNNKEVIKNVNNKKLENTIIEIGEEGEYILYDSNGNEVARDEDKYMLQKYIDNPNYNQNPSY